MDDTILMRVENLSIEFDTLEGTVHAVNGLSYNLSYGEKLGIVGESGSGKSVSSLAALQLINCPPGRIVQGKIFFDGQNILAMSEKEMTKIRGNKISMIFQEPMTSLNPIKSCGKQIAEVFRVHQGAGKKEAMNKAIEMMKAVGIPNAPERAKQYPHQMSGGMRQRIMIAIALACKPELLIADEPTTALDVTVQAQILDLIRDMNRELNTAVIFISHDLGVVSEICDRILVMYNGRVVEEAITQELFDHPMHPYTKGLLDTIPVIEKERKRLLTIPGTVPNPTEKICGCSFFPRCKYSTRQCETEEPPMKDYAGHMVRCWKNNFNEV